MTISVNRKHALLLNFTANSYHWGCYGTSMELYDSLQDRGYYLSVVPVETSHTLMNSLPTEIAQFDNGVWANRFGKANPNLARLIATADAVVCNGEGTMHHLKVAPWQLLYLLYYAKKFHGKKVHLINQSTYPSGGFDPAPQVDDMYGEILSKLDVVTSREIYSTRVLKRLGVDAVQSFDCLPRFIDRHGFARDYNPDGPLLLSGGVALGSGRMKALRDAIAPLTEGGRKIQFLIGAKAFPAQEDKWQFEMMQKQFPQLELVDAPDMETWLNTIGNASLLVSGRFHHSIAAASLKTPFLALPSNTLKIEAICEMMKLPAPIDPETDGWQDRLVEAGNAIMAGDVPLISDDTWAELLRLGEQNFKGL